jgi:hypothetical protein
MQLFDEGITAIAGYCSGSHISHFSIERFGVIAGFCFQRDQSFAQRPGAGFEFDHQTSRNSLSPKIRMNHHFRDLGSMCLVWRCIAIELNGARHTVFQSGNSHHPSAF